MLSIILIPQCNETHKKENYKSILLKNTNAKS